MAQIQMKLASTEMKSVGMRPWSSSFSEHFWSLHGHYEVTTRSLRFEFSFMNGSSFDSRCSVDHFGHVVTVRSTVATRLRSRFGFMKGQLNTVG